MENRSLKYLIIISCLFVFIVSCSNKNIVEGYIGYPSDYVPEMEVYLENIESGILFKQVVAVSFDGESRYSFNDVPDGKYIAYAVPTEEGMEVFIGGSTNAVLCGLKAECVDHDYIYLDERKGAHLKNINIYDWYMGDAIKQQKQYYI